MRSEDQQSRVLYELCALLFTVLRSPPGSDAPSPPLPPHRMAVTSPPPPRMRLSPAALASLLFGASLALMLCGSVTFVIGFVLMPWVIGLVVALYFVGIVSALSGLGRAVFCPRSCSSSGSSTNPKDMSGHLSSPKFL